MHDNLDQINQLDEQRSDELINISNIIETILSIGFKLKTYFGYFCFASVYLQIQHLLFILLQKNMKIIIFKQLNIHCFLIFYKLLFLLYILFILGRIQKFQLLAIYKIFQKIFFNNLLIKVTYLKKQIQNKTKKKKQIKRYLYQQEFLYFQKNYPLLILHHFNLIINLNKTQQNQKIINLQIKKFVKVNQKFLIDVKKKIKIIKFFSLIHSHLKDLVKVIKTQIQDLNQIKYNQQNLKINNKYQLMIHKLNFKNLFQVLRLNQDQNKCNFLKNKSKKKKMKIYVQFVIKMNQILYLCHADMGVFAMNVQLIFLKELENVIFVEMKLNKQYNLILNKKKNQKSQLQQQQLLEIKANLVKIFIHIWKIIKEKEQMLYLIQLQLFLMNQQPKKKSLQQGEIYQIICQIKMKQIQYQIKLLDNIQHLNYIMNLFINLIIIPIHLIMMLLNINLKFLVELIKQYLYFLQFLFLCFVKLYTLQIKTQINRNFIFLYFSQFYKLLFWPFCFLNITQVTLLVLFFKNKIVYMSFFRCFFQLYLVLL
ncbi:zinc finger domain protein, partial [Ichthyophthirius multifiliis]